MGKEEEKDNDADISFFPLFFFLFCFVHCC